MLTHLNHALQSSLWCHQSLKDKQKKCRTLKLCMYMYIYIWICHVCGTSAWQNLTFLFLPVSLLILLATLGVFVRRRHILNDRTVDCHCSRNKMTHVLNLKSHRLHDVSVICRMACRWFRREEKVGHSHSGSQVSIEDHMSCQWKQLRHTQTLIWWAGKTLYVLVC